MRTFVSRAWIPVVACLAAPGCEPAKVGKETPVIPGQTGGRPAREKPGADGNNPGSSGGVVGGSLGSSNFLFADAAVVTDAGLSECIGDECVRSNALVDCGLSVFRIERSPPEIFVVLDRSGSMARNVEDECIKGVSYCRPSATMNGYKEGPSRWEIATRAVNEVVARTEDDIAWGLKLFPTCKGSRQSSPYQHQRCDDPDGNNNWCMVDGLETAPMLSNSKLIMASLADSPPIPDAGSTPTGSALRAVVASIKAHPTVRPQFILLVTDGAPYCMPYTGTNCRVPFGIDGCNTCGSAACEKLAPSRCTDINEATGLPYCPVVGSQCERLGGCDASADAVKAVQEAAAAGIPVFVVGFAIKNATAGNLAHLTLNQLAEVGGRAVVDPTYKYFRADDQASLGNVLKDIAAAAVGCTFALDEVPAPDAIAYVTVDGGTLVESETNGWSFGPLRNAIRFNGNACKRLREGEFKETRIAFGCPQRLPEPPPTIIVE